MIDPKLIEILRNAQHVVVFTGAGVSAESGVPTFRDAQTGLWAQYSAEELATPEAFLRHPQLVWDWYMWRRELVAQAQPNPAHVAIAQMQRLLPKLTLITQNVDGLHLQAGSTDVLELHGNIGRTKCFSCGVYVDSWQDERHPPHCVQCDGLLRPDVVWFGESLPTDILAAARQAVEQCDVLISVGTSGLVYPAAELPFDAAAHGAIVVQVNPIATPLDGIAPFNLRGNAGEWLPCLIDFLGD